MWKIIVCLAAFQVILAQQAGEVPDYIKPCHRDDPDLLRCFMNSLEHVKPYIAKGIPEIELPSVEPFKMDELGLQLTDGPQGYKITLKNIEVFGASNFAVKSMKLSENGEPFKATIFMPKLKIEAKYTSSGVLLIIPASGGGDFHAVFEGCKAEITGKVSTPVRNGLTYLHVDALGIVLDMEKASMKISNAFRNNPILLEATNLFLRDNARIVLEAMQPQMQKKLANEFGKLANQFLKHVPRDWFYL
ncbi:protein takeout [Stomoxys calcitrans]|uniref:Haemolymph juvenile hormone binding protein n=1 Tax=Stomoxys calcitrans TaxID=35570 RepID=A0A1I8PQD0_STOCA|nr:protein takeout [Stomoxys calcitrans]